MLKRLPAAALACLLACAVMAEEPGPSPEDKRKSLQLYEDGLKLQKRDIKAAAANYEQALKLDPANWKALNHYAWFLGVTAPAGLRDTPRALQLAQRAAEATQWRDRDVIDTLAEVRFQRGEFAQAVETQKKALLPGVAGKSKIAYIQEQLAKFEKALKDAPQGGKD